MNGESVVIAKCPAGHEQTFYLDPSLTLEWAQQWAGLLDGSSPLYVHSPIGTDSPIGKCCFEMRGSICGEQFRCEVFRGPVTRPTAPSPAGGSSGQ